MCKLNQLKFISFEGIIGSGKTTQSRMLYQYLKNKGKKVILTREIGGSSFGEKVRDFFVKSRTFSMSKMFLVLAARYDHLHRVVFPALVSNHIVICDRFIDSTFSHHQDQNLTLAQMIKLHQDFFKLNIRDLRIDSKEEYDQTLIDKYSKTALFPDITLLFELNASVALKRAQVRDTTNNDPKGKPYYNIISQIEERFLQLEKAFPDRFKRVNCIEKNTKQIFNEILNSLHLENL